jgi:hypothetical protein
LDIGVCFDVRSIILGLALSGQAQHLINVDGGSGVNAFFYFLLVEPSVLRRLKAPNWIDFC